MSKEKLNELKVLVAQAEDALQKAMDFADKNGLPFSFSTIDMNGSTYDPKIVDQESYKKYVTENFGYIEDVNTTFEEFCTDEGLPTSFAEYNELEDYEKTDRGFREGWANSSTYC